MAQINLNLSKDLFVPKFFPLLLDYSHRFEVHMGSAGSAKSYFIVQKLIVRAWREKVRILVCRRTQRSLRESTFSLFKEILTQWQIINYVKIRETDMTITFPNSSQIIFLGLDEESKLLSINNISVIFCEEAFEIPKNFIEQLNYRLRGEAANKQMIMAFNPISKNHWLYDFCEVNPPENFLYTHSTYKDNPFLDAEVVAAYDADEIRNPAKYRIYGRGEWGVDPEGLVITNFKVEEFDAMALASAGLERRVGMDVGWIDKSAIIDTLYDRENKTIYVFNEFYKSGCQLSELADAMRNMNLTKTKVYVDAAESRSIAYFKQEGLNAHPCLKGAGSVKAGYMFLQDHLIIVHPKCKNLIMEFENLTYKKSKQTGEYTDEFEDHTFTHACDGLRYGYSDIYTNKKLKTVNKLSLGL